MCVCVCVCVCVYKDKRKLDFEYKCQDKFCGISFKSFYQIFPLQIRKIYPKKIYNSFTLRTTFGQKSQVT